MSAYSVRQNPGKTILSGHIESAVDQVSKKRSISIGKTVGYFIGKENKMAYNQNNPQRNNDEVHFDLMEHIAVIGKRDSGWTREVNVVAWNGGKAKVDIRDWDPGHERMSRGITLMEDEAENLVKALAGRYGLRFSGSLPSEPAAAALAAAPPAPETAAAAMA